MHLTWPINALWYQRSPFDQILPLKKPGYCSIKLPLLFFFFYLWVFKEEFPDRVLFCLVASKLSSFNRENEDSASIKPIEDMSLFTKIQEIRRLAWCFYSSHSCGRATLITDWRSPVWTSAFFYLQLLASYCHCFYHVYSGVAFIYFLFYFWHFQISTNSIISL